MARRYTAELPPDVKNKLLQMPPSRSKRALVRLFKGEDPDRVVEDLALEVEDFIDARAGWLRVGGQLLAVYKPLTPTQRHELGRPSEILVGDVLDLSDFIDLWSRAVLHESISLGYDDDEVDLSPVSLSAVLATEAQHDLSRIPPGVERLSILRLLQGEALPRVLADVRAEGFEVDEHGGHNGWFALRVADCVIVYQPTTPIDRARVGQTGRGVRVLVSRILYPAGEYQELFEEWFPTDA